jgi:hypothetical protein
VRPADDVSEERASGFGIVCVDQGMHRGNHGCRV